MSAMLEFDTGPLNWVRGDIEAALKSAADRIRAYHADPSLGNALRLARDEAHQATGALRMVGLEGAAAVASSLEETLSAMDSRTVQLEQATDTILDALESLLKWVARMAEGRGEGELALFPIYRKLRELNGAERVFEGELFFPSLHVRPTQSAPNNIPEAEMASLIKSARAGFQRGLLAFLRGVQVDVGLVAMRKSLSQIESAVPSPAARTFWWACVGFIDALQNKGVEPDFHVKQLLARIDLQMRRLMDGAPQVAERLMRDALFFIAKSKSVGDEAQAVRSAFSLEKYLPKYSSMDADRLAHLRPLLNGLKETLTESRHHWNAFAEGNAAALDDFQSCAIRFNEQATALELPTLNQLSGTLSEAAASITGLGNEVRDAVRLEIATTLLFLQNSIGSEDIFDRDFPFRAESQVRRINVALSGRAESSAEDLLDEGTRKAAEHALLTQLGREIISSLQQMEESLDAFFRDPQEREALSNLEALTTQIQGALTMLDQEDASLLLKYAMDLVNPYLVDGTPSEEEKTKVADALSSIGLFIEAHCAGRQDAARILMPVRVAYGLAEPEDADTSVLPTIEDGLEARKAKVAMSYLDWQSTGGDDTKKKFFAALTELGHDADLIANSGLKSAVDNAIRTAGVGNPDSSLAAAIAKLTGHDIVSSHAHGAKDGQFITLVEETISVVDGATCAVVPVVAAIATAETAEIAEPKVAPESSVDEPRDDVPTSPAIDSPAQVTEEDALVVDSELLEIFLEEANEVLQTLSGAVAACPTHGGEKESLAVIRRAFHTLKGMVGLANFGEVAWGIEQLMNNWLADEKPAARDLLDVVMQAHAHFSTWIAQLKDGGCARIDSDALLARVSQVAHGVPVHSESPSETATEKELASTLQETPAQGHENLSESNVAEIKPEPEYEAEDILIAGVRLSPGLYQIFKDESGLWSQTLREELEELAAHEVPIVSESARRGVHTLAGIAGTTGFNALSDLAHSIEIYLKELDDRPLPRNARTTVMDALSRVIGMIENIHAGATLLPADGLIRALAGLQLEEYLPSIAVDTASALEDVAPEEVDVTVAEPLEIDSFADKPVAVQSELTDSLPEIDIKANPEEFACEEVEVTAAEPLEIDSAADEPPAMQSGLSAILPKQSAPGQAGTAAQTNVDSEPDNVSECAPAIQHLIAFADNRHAERSRFEDLAAPARLEANAPIFEQRQVRDEIDAELLPIFLEEADGLIPKAADSLRQWKAQPSGLQAPSELRRLLHTIKGSARMAGAMRLGELTHIMETRVITVLEGDRIADSGIFETLENQFDRMANDVDRLKTGTPEPGITQSVANAPEISVIPPTDKADVPANEAKAAPTLPSPALSMAPSQAEGTVLRVRSEWVDRMVNEAGEVAIARSRIESEMFSLRRQVTDLSEALRRLKDHMREVEIQAEAQMQATFQSHGTGGDFDPLEFDRFTRFQEVTRFLAESVHDISTIQQNLRVQLGEADAALIQQARMNRELQQNLLRVRMVPLHSVSERLYRVVRQTGRDLSKRAQLDIRNGDLELDRGVLEKVVAPLEHLLRNAVAHGMESPETRKAAGKPEFGEISIDARQEGNEMVLAIKDDGGGLNLDRIRDKALALNLLSPGVEPSDSQLAQMIFVPGFSTADQVTEVAGRGVGMDVVKNEINRLGGRIEIASETGRGVTFSIYLPLTLAVTQAVIVAANKQEYAIPATMVEQVQELKPDHLTAAMDARAIEWRGNRYPLFYLPHLLGQMDAIHEVQRFNTVVLMKSGPLHAAVLVDVVEGTREIVVKNIGPQVARITGIAGATVRGDGKVMLILNPVPLAVRALNSQADVPATSVPTRIEPLIETTQAPMVLVVDDSVTVRKITGRLMVREGYRVDTAKDGVDALEKMQDLVPDVVLLDVEMPRMDGFGLARVMRDDPKLKNVPIIMITSRTADKHRNHALEIGVNVYLGKPFQEAVLLGHIGELVGERIPTRL
jgi:chemosensory pili system protein ChpA (sensor histidine kinase/response regulator)